MRAPARRAVALRALLAVGLVLAASACGDAARPARATADAGALGRAQAACAAGDAEGGLAAVDSVLSTSATADALVVRALCRWLVFDDTGELGEAAEQDLTDALAVARADGAEAAALARIYSHRAALRRARGAGWPATLADLDAAVEADTAQPLYVLDRAVARLQRGDSAAAVRDLDRYLQLDTLASARGDFARQLRDEARPQEGRSQAARP